ncbi:hypothetical protein [Tenacibaculum amylolyticum]|uniref:hypothetical protein n=1 Tax=Tenacibaculum amylolyticum TaxID=104269 RepID=UPI0038963C80
MEWSINKLIVVFVVLSIIGCKKSNKTTEVSQLLIKEEKKCIQVLTDSINYKSTQYDFNIGLIPSKIQDSINVWIKSGMLNDNIEVVKIFNNQQEFFIAISVKENSTGLASNFYDILILSKEFTFSIRSLSKDSKLFYFNDLNEFNFYTLNFSDEFIFNKDWDNPSFKVQGNKIIENTVIDNQEPSVIYCSL